MRAMPMTAAERQRKSRGAAKTRREKIAPALCAVGRLGEWNERDLSAIDAAILRLAADWAEMISSNVTCDAFDPVPRCTLTEESVEEESEKDHAR